jgi:hypothetical protein
MAHVTLHSVDNEIIEDVKFAEHCGPDGYSGTTVAWGKGLNAGGDMCAAALKQIKSHAEPDSWLLLLWTDVTRDPVVFGGMWCCNDCPEEFELTEQELKQYRSARGVYKVPLTDDWGNPRIS